MIVFNAETHEYINDGKVLISVTQLMQKHGLCPEYGAVNQTVLNSAAEHGKIVHEEISDFVKTGETGFTEESDQIAQYFRDTGSVPLQSEPIVYNDICAGTFDLLFTQGGENVLAEIKTTSIAHKDAISWQLSLYKHLFEGMDGNAIKIDKFVCFHFNAGGLKIVDIAPKPDEEVKRLLQCERDGIPYQNGVTGVDMQISQLADVETIIKEIECSKKQAEERAQELRAAIMSAMKSNGVSSFENERIKISYVAPSVRLSVDTERLKKDMPEVYQSYLRESQIKESLRITLKGE